jgi:uncharacterized membrane protein YidH (DUF202 family)
MEKRMKDAILILIFLIGIIVIAYSAWRFSQMDSVSERACSPYTVEVNFLQDNQWYVVCGNHKIIKVYPFKKEAN